MPFGRLIENKIREAIERGEFDNLPGKGKPLDLTESFNTPGDLRLGYAMLKKLKVYATEQHPHSAQQPKALEINA